VTCSFQDLKNQANQYGFCWIDCIDIIDAPGFERFRAWIQRGYHGSMRYLEERQAAYENPRSILEQAKTIVMLAMPYTPAASLRKHPSLKVAATEMLDSGDDRLESGRGRVAAYATGDQDYHDVIHTRLRELKKWLSGRVPRCAVRGVVDTAPILERDFAAAAGLGWIGKNTLLLRKDAGSYFFLAALLTDVTFEESKHEKPYTLTSDHCGTCTACLDACPTQAFVEPRILDASRCISYLTIEHRGNIEESLREKMGSWVLGCDVCQQVCPWNRMAVKETLEELSSQPSMQAIDLIEILQMSEDHFRAKYRSTPLWRPRLRGMQRNAMIALANQKLTSAIAWIKPFQNSEDSILSETATWAIATISQATDTQ
jgi:epoxyqueuosine reductase